MHAHKIAVTPPGAGANLQLNRLDLGFEVLGHHLAFIQHGETAAHFMLP
jgi:hypothetical protein